MKKIILTLGGVIAMTLNGSLAAGEGGVEHHMHRHSIPELIERFESPERQTWQKPDRVLEKLGSLEGQVIADLGAGSGYFSLRFLKAGAKVVALDIQQDFLEYIRVQLKALPDHQSERMTLRKVLPANPQLKDQEVDILFCSNTWHHVDNRVAYLAKVKMGLKSTGSLVILDFKKGDLPAGPPDAMKLTPEAVISELEQAGFQVQVVDEDTFPYQYWISATLKNP